MGYYNYYPYFDSTYILVLIGAIISIWASARVKSTYTKYAQVTSRSGITGAEAAGRILRGAGIYDVTVQHVPGSLTDHFDPRSKVLRLSDSVYSSSSVAAIGVAAHECGHAMQHNEDYFPLKLRSAIVPVANFGSKAGIPIIIAGVVFSYFQPLITVGILLFSLGVAFQLVTLPVEFDASRRALAVLEGSGMLQEQELGYSRKVLKAAALTYVAAAAASILQLLRLILLFGGGRRRRD
ncbi:MAG: zinc metallopeptidase [Lachnospiraceae bacterium]